MNDSASVMQQAQGLLEIVSSMFNSDPNLQEELKNDFGWHNLTVGLKTEDESLQKAIAFHEGEVQILDVIPEITFWVELPVLLRKLAICGGN